MNTAVLSIDGGGMKGIVSALVLIELEELIKKYAGKKDVYLVDYFDLIAGTSTGSILSGLLLCPDEKRRPKYTAKDALELYLTHGKEMFQTDLLHKIVTVFGLVGPKYQNKNFEKALMGYFNDVKTSELLCPCLLTSYNTQTNQSVFFNSLSSQKDEKRNYYLREAVLASTAAPTYFPPSCTRLNNVCMDCLVDGGVFANNPALCALIEALKLRKSRDIHNTMVLSIGNVSNAKSYPYRKVRHWGIANWALPILNILMDASEQTTDYQLDKLYTVLGIPNQYLRVAAHVKEDIPSMDDTSEIAIQRLLEIGKELVRKEHRNLDSFAKDLVRNRNS
jgi:patatin-like phospholipase/acyl hydrolase